MTTRVPLIVNAIANQIQELPVGDSLVGIATVTATTFIGAGTIPVGGIIMWSGSTSNIPTGWALCNGSNATPDLRNKFVIGAHSGAGIGTISTAGPGFSTTTGALSADYTPGNTGGETAHQLTTDELASHTHTTESNNATGGNYSGGGNSSNLGAYAGTNTGSAGSSRFHENRPPYYALAFIMRTV